MISVKDTTYYQEAIHELNYSFGTFFLFDGYVIGEIKEGEICTWEDHGIQIMEDLSHLFDSNGKNLIYISNRVNTYSLKPADWLKFFKSGYKIKGYGIITYSRTGYLNALLEKLFINSSFKRFNSLDKAVSWAKVLSKDKLVVS